MRPNTRYTRVQFYVARLAHKAEWLWWTFLAWCCDQRARYWDRQTAEGLSRDPLRFGRRPYEHNVTQDPKW